jgi:DNA (cytosine-5)-methyltransferase 1
MLVGTVYRRTRPDGDGNGVQRAEVRFDNISGCLRTPVGGSSRQTIMIVEGNRVRSRLLSSREAARLMGVPEDYPLPANYNEAYHLLGDGLVVPVVAWLGKHLLGPLALSKNVDQINEHVA